MSTTNQQPESKDSASGLGRSASARPRAISASPASGDQRRFGLGRSASARPRAISASPASASGSGVTGPVRPRGRPRGSGLGPPFSGPAPVGGRVYCWFRKFNAQHFHSVLGIPPVPQKMPLSKTHPKICAYFFHLRLLTTHNPTATLLCVERVQSSNQGTSATERPPVSEAPEARTLVLSCST